MQDTVYISGLEPLIPPDSVAFWPPAPGWYVLAGLILLAVLLLAWLRIRSWKANRYRRLALNRLEELSASLGTQVVQGDIQALNRLLKQTALSVFPREQVAALHGKSWLEFLDQHCSKTDFSGQDGMLLLRAAYESPEAVNISENQWNTLIYNAKRWIRKHKIN